jgi:hypothetical protein
MNRIRGDIFVANKAGFQVAFCALYMTAILSFVIVALQVAQRLASEEQSL